MLFLGIKWAKDFEEKPPQAGRVTVLVKQCSIRFNAYSDEGSGEENENEDENPSKDQLNEEENSEEIENENSPGKLPFLTCFEGFMAYIKKFLQLFRQISFMHV